MKNKEFIKKVNKILEEIEIFKEEPLFKKIGVAINHKYNPWFLEVTELKRKQIYLSDSYTIMVSLENLVYSYVVTKGEPSERSNILLEVINDKLKIIALCK